MRILAGLHRSGLGALVVRTRSQQLKVSQAKFSTTMPSKIIATSGIGYGLLVSGGVFAASNALGFAVTASTRTHKVWDLLSSGPFVASAIATFLAGPGTTAGLALTTVTCLWSVRLTSYLFKRVLERKTDSRFDDFLPADDVSWTPASLVRLGSVWSVMAMWGFVVSLPATITNSVPGAQATPIFWVCIGGQVLGFVFETIADYQKDQFKKDPANKDEFMSKGLWAYSRHPNYFGEIFLWTAATGATIAACGTSPAVLASIASPALTTLLLTKVSGVNLAEESSDRRYGDRADYKIYKSNTSILIPTIPKKKQP